uniref:Post-glycosylphosphatidylinositol attachment to proteins 6 n=1 Tax=Xiphophorus couchianus TaxID=32473 RepID=A0A3B5LH76_9TELE
MLLTLSNLFFLPAIVVAIRRSYITEAFVYLFTMSFSTFYHACDQPGAVVLCIMDYDALQYCLWPFSFYNRFTLQTMSMQLDRKGLWNLLGPILCAILLMVYRGVRRRHCYPPSWRRWVFYLLPGALCALIGVCLYVFAETESNYYYTHSLWHILVASCVVFLLPPREKDRKALGWSRGLSWSWRWSWRPRVCGYTLCESSKDELYTVT